MRHVLARGEALFQELMGLSGDHDFDLVSLGREVVEHDRAPGRMPHPLADDTIENPHVVSDYRREFHSCKRIIHATITWPI